MLEHLLRAAQVRTRVGNSIVLMDGRNNQSKNRSSAMKPATRAIGHVLDFSGVFSMDPMNVPSIT